MERHALRWGVAVLGVVTFAFAAGSGAAGCGSSSGGSGAGGSGGEGGASSSGGSSSGASSGGSGSGSSGSGGSSSGSGSGSTSSGSSSGSGSGSSGGDGGIVLPSGRSYPDTWGAIGILADQFPSGMSAAQQQFVATHFVGTEKQVLPDTQALRAHQQGLPRPPLPPGDVAVGAHRELHHRRQDVGQRLPDGDDERDVVLARHVERAHHRVRREAPDERLGAGLRRLLGVVARAAGGRRRLRRHHVRLGVACAAPGVVRRKRREPGPAPRGHRGARTRRSRSWGTSRGSPRGRRG